MRRHDMLWAAGLALALALGCSDEPGDTTPDTGISDGAAPDAGPTPIASTKFDKLSKWAEPIDDYIQAGNKAKGAGKFLRQIHDLIVYKDRLYLGYGDANVNMGRVVPISFRYLAAPTSTKVTTEFDSQDEHLERYRRIGDDLFMAGIDSTEDAWLGNVYYKRGSGQWVKSRTLKGGVHVHDVVQYGSAIYAVGSGATKEEWNKGQIFGHLWKSTDSGKTFKVEDRKANDKGGDCRFVRLLPTAKQMFMFGYKSNKSGTPVDVINSSYDGTTRKDLPDTHPLRHVWANEVYTLSKGLHVVRGSKILVVKKLVYSTWRVTDDGKLEDVKQFAKQTVIDLYPVPGRGETLVLSHDENDATAVSKLTDWKLHIYVTSDFKTFKELISYSSTTRPKSIAYWHDAIYVGGGAGAIWRAKSL